MTDPPGSPGPGAASDVGALAHEGLWIDGHLDLAFNVQRNGRDLTLPLDELRTREAATEKEAMATLPELVAGGLDIVFATLFVLPGRHADSPGPTTYDDPEEARTLALDQLALYERWEDEGRIRILRTREDLEGHLGTPRAGRPLGVVVLMEGADPIRSPAELAWWVARGVRMVGPSWKRTRYAGGTGEPGGLTAEGRELIDAMSELGVALDVSHMAEEAFWEATRRHRGVVLASHSNARALVDSDRQLSDEMLAGLAARDGVVGLVLADKFLRPGGNAVEGPAVGLADVARQARHVAGIVGWERVAIGSDFDGGFGRQETPVEVDRAGAFGRLGEAVEERRDTLLGGAWGRVLRALVP